MDLAAFDALAKTLHLDEQSLDLAGTIRPGTLAIARARPLEPGEGAPGPSGTRTLERTRAPAAEEDPLDTLPPTATLPRLDVRAAEPFAPGDPTASRETAAAELVLTSILGEGGMGVVWLARQRSLGRDVAVKQLRSGAVATSASGRALLREARATGALEHPSIVPVHGLGLGPDGSPLLVMKRVEGASIAELLANAEHPAWPELERRHGDRLAAQLEVLGRVADALHFAHSRGLVHRDVKPENVMVGSFGEVYLLDWGLALRPDALGPDERASISIVGTPGFLAPEMVSGDASRIDPRTDVYLLGGTLHAILTGRPRHEGASLRQMLVAAVLSEPFRHAPSVPAELAALANEATAADPAARPATAAAFRERLTQFLRHRGSLRLAEEARARLADVLGRASSDGAPPHTGAAAALLECRFGFTQALRDWPGNDVARAGLRETIRALAQAELARKSPDAAAELARTLDPADPEIDARITALRAELAEGKRLEESARREAHERDPRIGARVGVFIQTGLILGMIAIGVRGTLSSAGLDRTAAADIARFALGLLSASVVTLGVFRARALANRWGRQMSGLLVVVLAVFAAAAGLVAARGGTGAEASAHSMAALSGVVAVGALGLDKRLWASAVAAALAAVVCQFHPPSAPLALGLAGVVSVAVFLPESIRDSRAPAPTPP